MKKIREWYERTTDRASVNSVATKTGLVQSTLNRQLQRGEVSAESVIAIARAYRVDVARALYETGFLTEVEIRQSARATALSNFSDREIADEVWKRMVEGKLDQDGEPVLSVVEGIDKRGAKPAAALKPSNRNEQFEQRE